MFNSPVEFSSFDGEYVKRLSDGDGATESHFVSYFSGLLAVKLRRSLRSSQEVEDLRQEVFLRVLNNLRSGEGVKHPERFGAYVFSVCSNVVLEHFRGQMRTSQWDQMSPEPKTPAFSAEQVLLTRESSLRVRMMIAELGSKDQGILNAVFFEERDKDSVCSEFGVTREYLRVLLHRAKNRLRQIVKVSTQTKRKFATNSGDSSL